MARVTLASQASTIELLKERLADARSRDMRTAPIGDVSMALLNRLDSLKVEKRGEIDEAEQAFDLIERAYDEADSADDRVRELNLS